jgi:hypothetical protein
MVVGCLKRPEDTVAPAGYPSAWHFSLENLLKDPERRRIMILAVADAERKLVVHFSGAVPEVNSKRVELTLLVLKARISS